MLIVFPEDAFLFLFEESRLLISENHTGPSFQHCENPPQAQRK